MSTELVVKDCNEIALRDDGDMSFQKFGEIVAFAKFCKDAEFLPKNMTVPQAAIAVAAGKQLGMSALAAIQNIAVINGRPAIWGDALGALVSASGVCEDEYSEEKGEKESFKIVYHVKRKGRAHEIIREFGYEDAKRAGLWGKQGPWTQYPKRMMLMRARAFAYRDAFSDVLKGCRIREEEEDTTTVIDITKTGKVSDPPYGRENGGEGGGKLPDGKKAGSLLKAAAAAGKKGKGGDGEAAAPADAGDPPPPPENQNPNDEGDPGELFDK